MLKKSVIVCSIVSVLFSHSAFSGPSEDAVSRGIASVQKNDYDAAIKEFKSALRLDPKNSKVFFLLSLVYANKGDFDQALKFSRDSVAIEPSFAAFQNIGRLYAGKGDYANALDAYQSALKLNAASATGWYELGLLSAGTAHFDEAITAYKKALELNPRLDKAYLGLGSAYYWSGNKASAVEQVKKLRELKDTMNAEALESWINNKESLKKEAAPKTPPMKE